MFYYYEELFTNKKSAIKEANKIAEFSKIKAEVILKKIGNKKYYSIIFNPTLNREDLTPVVIYKTKDYSKYNN